MDVEIQPLETSRGSGQTQCEPQPEVDSTGKSLLTPTDKAQLSSAGKSDGNSALASQDIELQSGRWKCVFFKGNMLQNVVFKIVFIGAWWNMF